MINREKACSLPNRKRPNPETLPMLFVDGPTQALWTKLPKGLDTVLYPKDKALLPGGVKQRVAYELAAKRGGATAEECIAAVMKTGCTTVNASGVVSHLVNIGYLVSEAR
jgi:hypothetical protein